ncbi:MAG: acyl-CoA dehydrogenase C-terminal domain-containing protein, partial [Desulfobacterales bacterium]
IAFGEITMTWRLLDMAVIAARTIDTGKKNHFLTGKLLQATYFADITLPHTLATMENALRQGREVTDMPEGAF